MDKEGCKNIDDGLPGTSKGVWNNGDTLITQHGDTLSVTIQNYEINPRWFPAALQHAYGDSNDYWDQKAGVWQTNRGVFTCQNLYIVVPFGEGEDYLPKKFGISGTIRLTLNDNNLRASGLSGQKLETVSDNSNQPVTTDDTYTEGVYISRKGSYTNEIWYSSRQSAGAYCGSGTYPDKENFNHGSDAVMIGGDVTANAELVYDAQGDQANIMQGVDVLMKYSTKCFELDKSMTSYYSIDGDACGNDYIKRFLWATKKDGTGWIDDDEMNNTKEEDLFYYESLDELEASGKICVGVLGTFRNSYSNKVSYGRYQTVSFLKAKNDETLVGEVGAIVVESNAWKRYKNSDLEQAPEIPTRIDIQNGTATEEQFDCESRTIKTNRRKYIKAEYDADGNFCEHTSGIVIGDSMLLVNYASKISVGIDQIGDDGARKKTYDLDNNQYTVDYTIKPSIPKLPVGATSKNTNVYIIAMLPEGLEYKLGSSTLSGTYLRSAIAGFEGNVDNGTLINPTVEKNEKGIQLRWTIPNIDITKEIPTLRFKARIASTTQRNTIFTLTASVQTDEDHRAPNVSYGNESSIEINTSRTTDVSLQTAPKKIMNESSSGITYDLQYTNNGSKTLKDKIFLVIMPTNDDGNSRYSGTYTLRNAQLKGTPNGYKAYYTQSKNGTNVTTKTTDGLTPDGIRSGNDCNCMWIEATIKNDGTINMPNSDVTAWCIIGDLLNDSPIKMEMSILPTDNQSGDRYTEQIWIDNSTTQASAYVVRRIIDGTCWIDWNANGRLDTNEQRISGIKVKLLYADSGSQVTNNEGIPFETITDDSGNYRFDGLPYGIFRIVFESGEKLVGYNLSPKNASNVSTALSSKADGKSDNCIINNVNMPESSEITYSPYLVQYQNVGFVPIIDLPFTGSTITLVTIGWITLICWCIAGAIGGFIIGRRFHELGTK